MEIQNAKILITDDSVLARKQLKDIILSLGTPIFLEATNGEDAIEIYKIERPDIVFLDIVMPKKDGQSAIKEIMDFDKDASIIVCSSVGTQSQLRTCLEAGAQDFIQKPINPNQVIEAITKALEGK